MSRIIDWNPADGQAFQGDVAIIPIPDEIAIGTIDEIKPIDGRLILQEGEFTGHHHAIRLPGQSRHFRDGGRTLGDPAVMTASPCLQKAFGAARKRTMASRARLYRDVNVANEMVQKGLLTRADLAVACLVIEGAPVVIGHEEHDGIRVPPGRYLIGRQIESAGAEERVVAD